MSKWGTAIENRFRPAGSRAVKKKQTLKQWTPQGVGGQLPGGAVMSHCSRDEPISALNAHGLVYDIAYDYGCLKNGTELYYA